MLEISEKKDWLCEFELQDGSKVTEEVKARTVANAREEMGDLVTRRNYRRGKVVGRVLENGDLGKKGDGWL